MGCEPYLKWRLHDPKWRLHDLKWRLHDPKLATGYFRRIKKIDPRYLCRKEILLIAEKKVAELITYLFLEPVF
jgi:hypothetical protein